ncbi:hypothetical protein GGI15_002275 [Coemansia interrupta]|uniref:Alpha/beta hydrolase fold-3 domain-containing protein n=1 Tax=Coemansia interrupta TaxID=1126814 RepID=A0A9W8LJK5_9FUNG|nr:hypothetical protein GGI15_002275 [Coemansia interrupta]
MDILTKASLIAGIAATATRSTLSYYTRGPRCKTWPLWFQLHRDTIYSFVKRAAYRSATEESIATIDFSAVHAKNRVNDLPVSEMPSHLGRFERGSIRVNQVQLNTEVFSGIGPAEAGLVQLTEDDRKGSNREITYDMLVAKALADDVGAFECKPLSPNERIILYLHGGAYTVGSAASHRGLTGRLVHHSGVRCVAVDYRLAPQHPFPAQLHDAYIAYQHLLNQGFKPESVILAGDSAGGNLVLALTLLLKHINTTMPCGLLLISPWVDLVSERPSVRGNAQCDYLYPLPLENPMTQPRMFYAPGRKYSQTLIEELKHPLVSPINAGFADFPPTLIQAGDKELMADDIDEMYHRMLSSNPDRQTRFTYECYPDMIHVFHQFLDLPCAQEAYISAGKFIKSL